MTPNIPASPSSNVTARWWLRPGRASAPPQSCFFSACSLPPSRPLLTTDRNLSAHRRSHEGQSGTTEAPCVFYLRKQVPLCLCETRLLASAPPTPPASSSSDLMCRVLSVCPVQDGCFSFPIMLCLTPLLFVPAGCPFELLIRREGDSPVLFPLTRVKVPFCAASAVLQACTTA